MNKLNKNFLAVAALMLLVFASCKDTVDYVAAPAVSESAAVVSFATTNKYKCELEPDAPTSIDIVVNREDASSALSLEVVFLKNESNIFQAPDVLNFAAGENTATLTISFPEAEIGVKYSYDVTFKEDEVNYYKGLPAAGGFIQRVKWDEVGTGVYIDGTISTVFGVDLIPVAVNIQKTTTTEGKTKYRFFDAYVPATAYVNALYGIYNGYPYIGAANVMEDNCVFILTETSQGWVYETSSMGMSMNPTAYGLFTLGTVYGVMSTNINTYPLGHYNKDINAVVFPLNSLYIHLALYQGGRSWAASENPTHLYLSMDDYIKANFGE